MSRVLTVMLAMAGLAGALRPAHAGDATPPVPGTEEANPGERKAAAIKLLDQGNALLEASKYAEALAKYEKAYQTFPSPKILLNIAEAHRGKGDAAQALEYYERFLAEAKLEPGSKQEQGARARIEELKEQVRKESGAKRGGYLVIKANEEGAEVSVDGKPAGTLPLAPIEVSAGEHTIVAKKEGFASIETRAEVKGGSTVPIDIKLLPTTPAVDAAPVLVEKKHSKADKDEAVTDRWWFWPAVGTGVVATAVVVIVAASGGSSFTPHGELGSSSTASWMKF